MELRCVLGLTVMSVNVLVIFFFIFFFYVFISYSLDEKVHRLKNRAQINKLK